MFFVDLEAWANSSLVYQVRYEVLCASVPRNVLSTWKAFEIDGTQACQLARPQRPDGRHGSRLY